MHLKASSSLFSHLSHSSCLFCVFDSYWYLEKSSHKKRLKLYLGAPHINKRQPIFIIIKWSVCVSVAREPAEDLWFGLGHALRKANFSFSWNVPVELHRKHLNMCIIPALELLLLPTVMQLQVFNHFRSNFWQSAVLVHLLTFIFQ